MTNENNVIKFNDLNYHYYYLFEPDHKNPCIEHMKQYKIHSITTGLLPRPTVQITAATLKVQTHNTGTLLDILSVWLAQLVKAPTLSQRACMFIRA